jgi:regulatory protein
MKRKGREREEANDKDKVKEAWNYLHCLLRYRPRSKKEAELRLRRRGFPFDVISYVLSCAKEGGLIDDEAFAKLWITDRIQRKPKGKKALAAELKSKGISEEIIKRAFAEIKIDEGALIRELVALRLERYKGESKEDRCRKTVAFLLRRGFPGPLVYKAVGEIFEGCKE